MILRAAAATLLALFLPMVPTPAAGAAAAGQQPGALQFRLEGLRPQLITADGPRTLVLRGTVTNAGQRRVTGLAVRVLRGTAVTDPAGARAALGGRANAAVASASRGLDGGLGAGRSRTVRIEVGLDSAAAGPGLAITEPGVYPLALEVSSAAGTAAARTLLPVVGAPGGQAPRQPPAGRGRAPAGTPLTVVWPLVAEPAQLPTGPDGPAVLRGGTGGTDGLRAQLAAGGRLAGLVAALNSIPGNGSPLSRAVCVAIDPALVDTVRAMTDGYRVRDPQGRVRPGTGADEARRWLRRLRRAVDGRCVLALPYADPDVVALAHAGLTGLHGYANRTGSTVIEQVLDVAPRAGLSWPAGGVVDARTLRTLTALGTRTVLLDPTVLSTRSARRSPTASVRLSAGPPRGAARGVLIDPLVSRALATPAGTGAAATQNAVAMLAYRGLDTPGGSAVVLAPPRRWRVEPGGAAGLLRGIRRLVTAGLLRPSELSAAAGPPPTAPAAALAAPAAPRVPASVTARTSRILGALADIERASRRDPAADFTPAALFDPVRRGLLRATSTAWRDQPARAGARIAATSDALAGLLSAVRIAPPPQAYTLTSSQAPLLVTVQNSLPVSMRVSVRVDSRPGLRAGPAQTAVVPARSTRQLRIPVDISRPGPLRTVARLTTPTGTALGQPTVLRLRSSSFDAVTLAVTGGAGAVLVLLVALRLVRRIRARPDEADPQ